MVMEPQQFTTNWSIGDLERMISDGYVYKVFWIVTATNGTYESKTYGSVDLDRPEELIPFENLTEELVISWVKSTLGEDSVRNLENNVILHAESRVSASSLSTGLSEEPEVSFTTGVPW